VPRDEVVKERLLGCMHPLLHDDARRLVEEDEGVVFEEDVEAHRLTGS
jgi:hypothetical protein